MRFARISSSTDRVEGKLSILRSCSLSRNRFSLVAGCLPPWLFFISAIPPIAEADPSLFGQLEGDLVVTRSHKWPRIGSCNCLTATMRRKNLSSVLLSFFSCLSARGVLSSGELDDLPL